MEKIDLFKNGTFHHSPKEDEIKKIFTARETLMTIFSLILFLIILGLMGNSELNALIQLHG